MRTEVERGLIEVGEDDIYAVQREVTAIYTKGTFEVFDTSNKDPCSI